MKRTTPVPQMKRKKRKNKNHTAAERICAQHGDAADI